MEPDVLPDVLRRLRARRLHERLLQLHRRHGLPQLLRQPAHLLAQIRPGAMIIGLASYGVLRQGLL